jgi:glycosyltransferase involved in cell wall biosynthesis
MDLMKILYMHRSLGDGGEGVHIRAMLRAFRARGHEVRVLAPGGDTIVDPGAVSRRTLLSSVLAKTPPALVELGELVYGIGDGWRGARTAREFKPDFVYARHAAYTTAPLRAARAAGVPLLLEVNAPLALERAGDELRPLRFERLAYGQERRIFDAADHLLVVSTPLADYLRGQGVRTPIAVVPNAIHPEVYADLDDPSEVRGALGISQSAIVIGFVGFIRAWHGVEMLVQSAARVASATGREVHLLVVGDGPALPELRETGAEMAAPATIQFTGRVSHDEIPRYLAAMDVTVSPKATFYACPLKLIEYMAAQTAVIAPDSPNILDVVEPEVDALTFPTDDEAGLTAALDRVVRDDELRARLGATAREQAMTHRTWEGNAERVEEIAAGHGV